MKRNCNGCKAFDNSRNSCTLGYNTIGDKMAMGVIVSYKPLEECPKPKTNNDFMFAIDYYKKRRK